MTARPPLRVLPLGGLGEIGKNMTVVEYEGRIVVVDTGLLFPTADMLGIDLVLPDFAYLRDRADDIEAIVVTHGHEDHLGALPWVLRELGQDSVPPVYGGPLTIAMARSKLDEHKLTRRRRSRTCAPGETFELGPVLRRDGPHDPLDPRLVRRGDHAPSWARSSSPATTSSTRRRWTAMPADVSRLAELGREGLLLLCGDSTNADRPGFSPVGVAASGRTWRRCSPAARDASSSPASPRTSTASSRWSTPPPRSGARSRWSAARCART